ncbi:MAG: GatB/YqeY domain-containing protein [Casimicrobiaceae bacterium]
MSLKTRITEDMKDAMRARNAPRLSTIRLLLAAIKQKEVDERLDASDADIVAIIERMIKQRRESISHFEAGKRADLAANERAEIELLRTYMPAALSDTEVDALLDAAIAGAGGGGIAAMGKVMAALKPQLAGRADLGAVSAKVKARLSG